MANKENIKDRQYETLKVIHRVEKYINSKIIVMTLEIQRRATYFEDGSVQRGKPYPLVKLFVNNREQYFFLDVSETIFDMLGVLLPKSKEAFDVIDTYDSLTGLENGFKKNSFDSSSEKEEKNFNA